MMEFTRPELTELTPRIVVIGVGGAGGNAVSNMIASKLQGVDFVVANTDAQSLAVSPAETRIQLGLKITQGLGAGSRPDIGRAAAEETMDQIDAALDGCHMCFITAGMGGGTGTGAAPVVARAARDKGILTVGVVTKPFAFEGARRMRSAEEGIIELQKHVDTLIIIPNQNLFLIANANTTFKEAFGMADQVLHQGVRGITDLMIMPGLINLDFADIRTVMSEMGKAMMGTGEARGENRAIEAAEKAIANPLLDEVSMRGAKGVIINITGGEDLRLMEVDEAATHIREMVDPDANIIVGSAFNPDLDGVMRVSVVATGIDVVAQVPSVPTRAPAGFGATPSAFPTVAAGRPQDARQPEIRQPEVRQPEVLQPGPRQPEPRAEPVAAPVMPVAPAPAADPVMHELDLSLDDIIEDDDLPREPAVIRFTPSASAAGGPAPAANPAAARAAPAPAPMRAPPVEEERPLSLFEKMMNLSRAPAKAPRAEPTLAPEPDAQPDGEVAIPRFFKRQVND